MNGDAIIYEFGRFRLDLSEQRLLRDQETIPLPPKVLDTLTLLVEHSGHILSKDEIMAAVSPNAFVEESSLTQNISLLRKALNGDDQRYIETVPKRGYRFVAPVRVVRASNNGAATEAVADLEFLISPGQESEPLAATNNRADSAGGATGEPQGNSTASSTVRAPQRRGRSLALLLLLLITGATVGILWKLRNQQQSRMASLRQQPLQSLAVLPFKTLSTDSADALLGLGLADALIMKLSTSEQPQIRPTSSVAKYAGKDIDPLIAGKELGVDAVLAGTVQRLGERARVTVSLISLKDRSTLWSEKYDEEYTDIFKLQDSVSAQVAGVLQLKLDQRPRDLNKRTTQNLTAYRHYTMGIYFWNKRTKAGLAKAGEYFRAAIAEDPNYAAAYAILSDTYLLSAYYGYDLLQIEETYHQARQLAIKAVELDQTLAEAHIALATIEAFAGNAAGAEESYRRAINLDPGSDIAHLRYGNFLVDHSRLTEAIRELHRAQELNPVSPTNATALASFLLFAGQYDKSVEYSKLALELDPQCGFARDNLGAAYVLQGLHREAIEEFTALAAQPDFTQYGEAGLAWVYARMGRPAEARLLLARLESEARCGQALPNLRLDIARVHGSLGDAEQALAWLQTAAENRRLRLHQLEYTSEFAALKDNARFIQIVKLVREAKPPLSELKKDTD